MKLTKREAEILHAAAGMDMFWRLQPLHYDEFPIVTLGLLVNYSETKRLASLSLIEYCGTTHCRITPEGIRVLNEHIGSKKAS